MIDREEIFKALFGLLDGVTWNDGDDRKFHVQTREIKLFSDVPSEQQPWIGQAEHSESFTQISNLPYRREWSASWIIYHKGPSPRASWNNLIISALEEAMRPKPIDRGFLDERNTLSGLVYHCFIEGEIFKDPGDIDGQAMLVVPIKLLVP